MSINRKMAQQSKLAKKTTASKAKKTASKKAAPAPAAPVEQKAPATPAPVANEVVEPVVTIESTLSTVLSEFSVSLQTLTMALNKLKSDFKLIEKQVLKEARAMDKVNAKRNRNKGARAPSGFVKPAKITTELADFLGVAHGTEMARTDVTREITKYVRSHKLQDKDNGRKINPDAKLRKLLKVSEKEEVTYFNLQKFMSQHFLKSA